MTWWRLGRWEASSSAVSDCGVCGVCVQETCYQYWPSSGSLSFGEFKVDLLGEEMMNNSVLKTFSVTDSEVCWLESFLLYIHQTVLPTSL